MWGRVEGNGPHLSLTETPIQHLKLHENDPGKRTVLLVDMEADQNGGSESPRILLLAVLSDYCVRSDILSTNTYCGSNTGTVHHCWSREYVNAQMDTWIGGR